MKSLTLTVLIVLCALSMAHDYAEHKVHKEEKHDYYAHPKYQFKYGVKDLKTEDIKEQWEHRDGDKVYGGYLLKEADGTTRVVNYHADDHSGFHADVKTIGEAKHPKTHSLESHSKPSGAHYGHAESYFKIEKHLE